jgi:hypothetical protein
MARRKSEPRIRRAEHNASNRYFMVVRATAQHNALSYEALGLLTYLLSNNDNWIVQPDELRGRGAGRDRIYKLLTELITLGYIERVTERDDKQRVTGVDYYVNEEPRPEKPDTALPDTALPDAGLPDTEKPHITKYKEETNTKKKSAAPAAQAPDESEPPLKVIKPVVEKPKRPIFDAIALGSFNIRETSAIGKNGGRIGKLEAWVKKTYPGATEKTITAFYAWYARTNPKTSAPRDLDKFIERFVEFHEAVANKSASASGLSMFKVAEAS